MVTHSIDEVFPDFSVKIFEMHSPAIRRRIGDVADERLIRIAGEMSTKIGELLETDAQDLRPRPLPTTAGPVVTSE